MKNKTPLITTLLPVHNGEDYLPEAIRSVITQSASNFELIIIDDGSTDRSSEIGTSFASGDSRVRYIKAGKVGLVAALELGRAQSQGRYIARMDADDVALPSRFEWQSSFLDAHPQVVAVGGQIRKINEIGRFIGEGRYPTTNEGCRRYLSIGSPFCHPAVMMKADSLTHCGGYRAKYAAAEDYDLWHRLAAIGEFANINETVLHYRVHSCNLTIKNAEQNAMAAALCLLAVGSSNIASVELSSYASPPSAAHLAELLPKHVRDKFWRHYWRFFVLNGGISQGKQTTAIHQLNSYRDLPGTTDDEVAFTLVRAIKILIVAGKFFAAIGALVIGLMRCSKRFLVHLSNAARRKPIMFDTPE